MVRKRTPLRQIRAQKAQKARSTVKTLPAPTGGWNARDALSDMPETDAVALVNFFPETTDCVLRFGSLLQATLTAGASHTGNAAHLNGTSDFFQTPDSVAISFTGDLDVRVYCNPTSTTNVPLVDKGYSASVSTSGYRLFQTGGFLVFAVVTNIGALGYIATALPVFGNPIWVRVTLDITNGVNSVVTFYTGTDGVNWTQLGATVSKAIIATVTDNALPLIVGKSNDGFVDRFFTGNVYRVQIYNGIAGTLAASFNGTDADIGATSVTSSATTEVWTMQSSAVIIYDAAVPTVSTPASNQVETLMAYTGGNTRKLFAINSGQIWNVTTQNAPTLFSTVSLGGSRWNFVNVATSGGNYLYMVNIDGLDSPYTYDGTTWAQPSITGVTTSTLGNINSFKNRLWFIQRNTLKAWYLPTASIAGAVNSLDLSAFFTRGGKLICMATWTIDAGYGVDDLAVFITDQGEAAVYRGSDPSSSATWALVGIYWMGSPVGNRPIVKFSGDCLVITQDGIVPLSGALQSSRTNPRVAISDKIQSAISEATSLYDNNFGWQIIPFPKQNMLLVNVPISEGVTQEQYVMNAITGAWARFTGWNANCWELFGDDIYFGGTNKTVMKAWTGTSDNSVAIQGNALQAFNYFGSSGQQKRFPMIRPVFLASGGIPLSARLNIDFDQNIVNTDFSTVAPVSGAVWDSAVWDVDVWQNDYVQSTAWRGGNGVGFCAAPEIGISTVAVHAKWVSTDIVLEPGAIL